MIPPVQFGFICGSMLFVAGCTLPEQPEHVAYASARNLCNVPVVVVVDRRPDSIVPEMTVAHLVGTPPILAPGEVQDPVARLALPLREFLYVWVADSKSEPLGEPRPVQVDGITTSTSAAGTITYHLVVEGHLCPEADNE